MPVWTGVRVWEIKEMLAAAGMQGFMAAGRMLVDGYLRAVESIRGGDVPLAIACPIHTLSTLSIAFLVVLCISPYCPDEFGRTALCVCKKAPARHRSAL